MLEIETEEFIYELELYHAQFNITSRCNMRCKHCRGSYGEAIDLELDDFERLVMFSCQHLAKKGGFLISGGEPLLHPKFKEIICTLKKYVKQDNFVSITTNGSFLDAHYLDFLEEKKFSDLRISISLDSVSANKHDIFRCHQGAYEAAINAIKLVAQRPGIQSIVRATITEDQLEELESMAKLVYSLGADILSISSVIPVGRALGKNMGFSASSKKKLVDKAEMLNKKYPKLAVDVNDPLAYILSSSDRVENYGGCIAGIGTFSVEPDGSMLPCPVMPNQVIMNVCGLSVDEILYKYSNNPFVHALIERRLKGKCGKCKLRLTCGGCRARAEGLLGDYLEEDPECWL